MVMIRPPPRAPADDCFGGPSGKRSGVYFRRRVFAISFLSSCAWPWKWCRPNVRASLGSIEPDRIGEEIVLEGRGASPPDLRGALEAIAKLRVHPGVEERRCPDRGQVPGQGVPGEAHAIAGVVSCRHRGFEHRRDGATPSPPKGASPLSSRSLSDNFCLSSRIKLCKRAALRLIDQSLDVFGWPTGQVHS
jgi:hypothetical protein